MSDYAPKPAPKKAAGMPKPKQPAPPAPKPGSSSTFEKLRALRAGREATKQIERIVLIAPRELAALYAARGRKDPAALQAAVRVLGMMRVTLEVGRAAVQHASAAAAPEERAQLQDAMNRASECIGRIANATGSDVPFASVDSGDRVDLGEVDAVVSNVAAGASAHEEAPTMHGFRVGPLVKNGGAPCDLAPDATGCVLDAERRRLALDEYRARLRSAQNEFHGAVAELAVDAKLEKSDEAISWMGAIFLDVLGTLVTGKLGIAFRLGRAAAGLAAGSDSGDDKRVDGIIKGAVGVAKKAIKPAARPSTVKVTFLDMFREQVNCLFAYLRYKVPSQVNDLELLALDEAFREEHHQKAAYKLALLEKLDRARASGLEKIGRRYEDARDGRRVIRDVGVIVRVYASGRSDVAYQHQDGYRPAQDHYRRPGPVPVEHELRDVSRSVDLGARRTRGFGPSRSFTDDPVLGLTDDPASLQVVPPEFVASALALHQRAWGGAPPIVFVDDRLADEPDGGAMSSGGT